MWVARLMSERGERETAQGDQEGPRGARAGAPSLRHLVRVARSVLRSELWGSYQVIMSADSVSVRVHRVQEDGKGTVSVPASRVPSGTSGKAQPLALTMSTKWRDMSKKEKKATRGDQETPDGRITRALFG